MALRKTKIVCTMGPAVRNLERIKELLLSGMNIARFNFSHGDHLYHQEMIEMVREASRQTSCPVALLLDTKGPEIRTGQTKDGQELHLVAGHQITLTTEQLDGTEQCLSISYPQLPREISPGKHIYIADGTVDLEVEQVEDKAIHCCIRQGGTIGSRKNINVIGVRTALPAITEKDIQDIVFGIEQGVDFIAASFVRKPGDILEIRQVLDAHNSNVHVIAKIEDEEGLDNLDAIINVANGVMVARGDLGVQLKTEEIPLVQKRIIRKCHDANKPVITATQMLDSMIAHPRPTRAEASDVANAIFDGTDAVMLSGETASGRYPVLAVQTMHNIAMSVEHSQEYQERNAQHIQRLESANMSMSTAIASAASTIADRVGAAAILTPTLRGTTPKLLSKYRPRQEIIAVTTTEQVQRNLLLYWGVYPIITELASGSDRMLHNAIAIALRKKYLRNNDRVVIVAGIPINSPVMLNTIRVHVISNILAKGTKGMGKMCTGRIVKANDADEALLRVQGDGDEILLTRTLDHRCVPLLPKLKGAILQDYCMLSPENILQISPDLAIISGVPRALSLFEPGLIVSMDAEERLIYEGVVEEKSSAETSAKS